MLSHKTLLMQTITKTPENPIPMHEAIKLDSIEDAIKDFAEGKMLIVVDDEKIITRKDLQECCDAIGIEFDCMNY